MNWAAAGWTTGVVMLAERKKHLYCHNLRVPFVPASMRVCLMGAELTGQCSSPIVCIQCTVGESVAFQLLASWRPYNVVLRHNTALYCLKLIS